MGVIANIFDKFNTKDFSISPNKKIKSVQSDFRENFGLCLRIYKGSQLADPNMTFASLNARVTNTIRSSNDDLIVKASTTIGDFEKLVKDHFGLKVQVADEFNTYLVNNRYTLGQAARKEDLNDWCKQKGFKSIDDWLKKNGCQNIAEYHQKKASKTTDR